MNRKQIKRLRGTMRKIASQVVRSEVLKLHKVKVLAMNGKGYMQEMIHHPCASCKKNFRPDEVELDHIQEVGEFKIEGKMKGSVYGDCRVTNWQEWLDRLFCALDNFQILCVRCHQKKTLHFNSGLRSERINRITVTDEELL